MGDCSKVTDYLSKHCGGLLNRLMNIINHQKSFAFKICDKKKQQILNFKF